MKFNKNLLFIGAVLLFVACAVNPFTGKKTLALVPNSQILPMAFQQYDQFLEE
ncbi:MAG TPA: M48 family peptidase, partial [Flavobacteriaceae bacterium]|nr:M48 family peptidase [Flavobacteriaceae bacterium]